MANDCIPYYRPGQDITGLCTDDVRGMRFAAVDGTITPGWRPEGLRSDPIPNVVPVKECGEGAQAIGVFSRDAKDEAIVGIITGSHVVPVTAGAAIVPGDIVESDVQGRAVPRDDGAGLGIAMSRTAEAGDIVAVMLHSASGAQGPEGTP